MTDADLLFTGGPALLRGGARASAVAVHNGRIVAVGEEVPAARTVDLRGRLLIPGFQDAHCHPVWAGLELAACDLGGAETQSGYLSLVDSYARGNPSLDWITGAGWAMAAFPGGLPRREPLDAVVPDRPVLLLNRDHHGAWVNSRALQLAGITAATPDPPDGRIERDPDGEPTGMLQEAALERVTAVIPPPPPAALRAALLRAQSTMLSYGITAWQDALVGAGLGQPDAFDTYLAAAEAGELVARVRGALWWSRHEGLTQLAGLRARRDAATHPSFRATTVKIMVDGVAENGFAALVTPYLDGCGHETDRSGTGFVDPVELATYVTALDREGFQVHLHTLGDRAVREALDAVAAATAANGATAATAANGVAAARAANGVAGARHHLAHLQVVQPADIPRFAALNVGATIQPYWAAHEPQLDLLAIPVLGPQRAAWHYPFADLAAAGAHLACGSDWPVSSVNPIDGIHVAVNRRYPDADEPVFLPAQRLSLLDAVVAYTAGSAAINGFDDAGEIRVGARADLVVLDRDPFGADPAEIHETRVLATYIAGREAFLRG